ncbi:MAG: hypothetical protein RRY36_03895 [Bacteroidaceae bacterium]
MDVALIIILALAFGIWIHKLSKEDIKKGGSTGIKEQLPLPLY